jgi:hypothetical protein
VAPGEAIWSATLCRREFLDWREEPGVILAGEGSAKQSVLTTIFVCQVHKEARKNRDNGQRKNRASQ